MSAVTLTGFLDLLKANGRGLWPAIEKSVTLGARGAGSFKLKTTDAHAVGAVRLVARRAGLGSIVTSTDEGLHVITVKGFAK